MADGVRQRRGKKTADTGTPSVSSSSGAATTEPETNLGTTLSDKPTPTQSLHNAHAKLLVARNRTADLHAAWKNHLFRLSLLIVGVSILQLQRSISSCIHEVKDSNAGGTAESTNVSGVEAIKLIFNDSCCEILGALISFLLAHFLLLSNTTGLELDKPTYMLSSALVPVCLGFYFHTSKQLGCLGGDYIEAERDEKRHQFPVIVIWHTIVTIAFWFMKYGMQQCEEHVKLVNESIVDFEKMEKKIQQKKKLKKGGGEKKK